MRNAGPFRSFALLPLPVQAQEAQRRTPNLTLQLAIQIPHHPPSMPQAPHMLLSPDRVRVTGPSADFVS